MKISNGCWIQKEGITAFFPQEVYFCDVKKDTVKLVAPTHHITQRGDTLGGVNITLEITAPMEGVGDGDGRGGVAAGVGVVRGPGLGAGAAVGL